MFGQRKRKKKRIHKKIIIKKNPTKQNHFFVFSAHQNIHEKDVSSGRSNCVGYPLALLQTWSPWCKKIAFRWGHQVSHISADRALARVKGHSAMTNCAVHRPPPSLHAALRAPPSSCRPFPDHVLSGCAWSLWSPPPVERGTVRVGKAKFRRSFSLLSAICQTWNAFF